MTGPAFRVRGMLVWGFTGALVDRLLTLAGWEQPWDRGRGGGTAAGGADPGQLTGARADPAFAGS